MSPDICYCDAGPDRGRDTHTDAARDQNLSPGVTLRHASHFHPSGDRNLAANTFYFNLSERNNTRVMGKIYLVLKVSIVVMW